MIQEKLANLGNFVGHLVQIHLVLAEPIDHFTEEQKENRHGGAVNDGAEATGYHQNEVVFVSE